MSRPQGVTTAEYKKLRHQASQCILRDRTLFRRAIKNYIKRRIIDDPKEREEIIEAMHDGSGHRGREGTYKKVLERYY